ncbi:MAG TPA: methyltransferase domain-containing protein [Acidimicrobiales bacterium]|nr:methyltransferase domain-containing protein [Acidimicrobiales bacterium]
MALTLGQRARLDFVLMARRAWAAQVYPALVASLPSGEPTAAADGWERAANAVASRVHASPIYPFFAFLERGLQKQLWRTVTDAVRDAEPADEGASGPELGSLELDPDLELPRWYVECDFHLQPGGVWQREANALVYQLGARVVMLGENDAAEFHRRFVATAIPPRPYRRIVDLGCGFGKSTFPLKEAFPDAEVIGIDLAANLLRMAHRTARRQGLEIRFRQADCTRTGLEDGSADLVSATMLVHELPPPVTRACIAEAARLLRPGGLLRVLDFHPTGDPVRDLAMVEHSDRNNEPYLRELFRSDVLGWCREAGLADARWLAFDERGAGRLDDARWPERPEWHFPWAVLEATRQ